MPGRPPRYEPGHVAIWPILAGLVIMFALPLTIAGLAGVDRHRIRPENPAFPEKCAISKASGPSPAF